MLLLSILAREFRAAARRKRTWVLRVTVAGSIAAVVLILAISIGATRNPQGLGRYLLGVMAWQMFILLFVVAPAVSAGVISDERKAGTLELLLLTHLRPFHILAGKCVSRGFDLLLLYVSVAPFLFVPMLLGGVNQAQILCIMWNLLGLLILALGIGVFCSTLTSNTLRAIVASYVSLSAYLLISMLWSVRFGIAPLPTAILAPLGSIVIAASPVAGMLRCWMATGSEGVLTVVVCTCVALLLGAAASWLLPRTILRTRLRKPGWWQEKWIPATLRRSVLPFWKIRPRSLSAAFWLTSGRGKSPWLTQEFGILLLILGLTVWLYVSGRNPTTSGEDVFGPVFWAGWIGLVWLKLLVLVFVARWFSGAKEDGTLELLLTTPVTNSQIVHGGVYALLGRYGWFCLAGVALFLLGGWIMSQMHPYGRILFPLLPLVPRLGRGGVFEFECATTVTSLICWVALSMYVSARAKSMVQAIAWTLAAWAAIYILSRALGVGLFGMRLSRFLSTGYGYGSAWENVVMLRMGVDITVAFLAYFKLHAHLREYAAR